MINDMNDDCNMILPKGIRMPEESVREAMGIIDNILMDKNKGGDVILPGWRQFDLCTGGFRPGELILLGGNQFVGKTACAVSLVEKVLFPEEGDGRSVLYFSPDMVASQLLRRMICSRSCVSMQLVRERLINKNSEEYKRLCETADEFLNSQFYIDDTSGMTIDEFMDRARKFAMHKHPNFIVLDSLQSIRGGELFVSGARLIVDVATKLMNLAIELQAPLLVICETAFKKTYAPDVARLSDLGDYKPIGDVADTVLYLVKERGGMPLGLHIVKCRQGTGVAATEFFNLFGEISRMELWKGVSVWQNSLSQTRNV